MARPAAGAVHSRSRTQDPRRRLPERAARRPGSLDPARRRPALPEIRRCTTHAVAARRLGRANACGAQGRVARPTRAAWCRIHGVHVPRPPPSRQRRNRAMSSASSCQSHSPTLPKARRPAKTLSSETAKIPTRRTATRSTIWRRRVAFMAMPVFSSGGENFPRRPAVPATMDPPCQRSWR